MSKRRCAVHFSLAQAMERNFPDVTTITDAAVVVDGNFITCPGGLAAINLAMHLVAERCGKTRSHKALHYVLADHGFDEIQVFRHGSALGIQCADRRVSDAIEYMQQAMAGAARLADVANAVGITERELTSLFRQHLHASPSEHWRTMRLQTARWMILNSDTSISQIACECGFTDSSHLIQWFRRTYGVTPLTLRKTHAAFGVH
jgi:transcriptional regulator GlxA family with amidase domain